MNHHLSALVMRKILAVLMTFSMVLAGCMDLTDEDVESIVDSIIELPGCNDDTAYNYDENATNNLACLTEQVLKQSVSNFINLVDNGPAWGETMGMVMEGSETDSDGMSVSSFTSTTAVSPDGMYVMTEIDMGMMVIEMGELMTENADGTTNIQSNWMGDTFQMNTEAVFDVYWNEQVYLADDDSSNDDMDMDMDMDMGLPDTEVEIPADFDPATALYTAGLSTSNGYSFTTTLEQDGDYTTTMTFTLSNDLVVTSLLMVESFDGMTSTSSISILDAEAADLLFVNDETLVEHALPFTMSPMDSDDHDGHDHDDHDGDHDDHDDDTMVCYDMNSHSVIMEYDNMYDCEGAGYMWTSADGDDDDHDGHEHGDDDGDHDEMSIEDIMMAIDDDGDNLLTWTEFEDFIINEDGGWGDEPDRSDTYDAFNASDMDDDGYLNAEEFEAMLYAMNTDEDDDGHDDHDNDHDDDLITPEQLLADIDSDESGTMSLDEFNAFFGGSEEIDVSDPEFSEIFDNNDADASGDLDSYELEGFIMELDAYLEGGHDEDGHDDHDGDHDEHSDDDMSEADAWALIDADADGYATVSEIIDGFNAMDAPTPGEAMEDADTDYSSGISWEEFVAEWNSEEDDDSDEHLDNNAQLASDLHAAFNNSDADSDGNLSIEELDSFIDQVITISADEEDTAEMTEFIQMFVNCADTDDDGVLDEIEFSPFYMMLNEESIEMAFCMFDTDGDGLVSPSDYASFMNDSDSGAEPMTEDDWDMIVEMIFMYDLDDNGALDMAEFDSWMMDMEDGDTDSDGVYWQPYHGGYCEWEGNPDDDDNVWSCKDDVSDSEWENWWYYCELHGDDWYCTDDYGQDSEYEYSASNTNYDHDGHDGHDGHDHDDHDDNMMAYDWMIDTADMMSDTEVVGAFADYHIVLANCVSESSDDMMDSETMSCGDDVLKLTIAEATTPGADIMFHDADSSGTITAGDMIHINPDIDAGGEWNTVRLYSVDADKYSDENPMMTPGFGAFAGIVALLGAALLTRRD
jgi:PGF-CTERM protein